MLVKPLVSNIINTAHLLDGVFTLLIINFALFLMDHVLHLPYMRMLYLNHVHPQWWQFVTSIFCHASWAHLSSNIFFLYIFGRAGRWAPCYAIHVI